MELLAVGGTGGKAYINAANYNSMQLASSTKYFCLICLPGSLFMHIRCDPTPLD